MALEDLPLLYSADLTHLGGFRVPLTSSNGATMESAGSIAYNPTNNSLFISSAMPPGGPYVAGHDGILGTSDDYSEHRLAEITIPGGLSTSANPADLPLATYLQGFYDPCEGRVEECCDGPGGPGLRGMVVNPRTNKINGAVSIYYDASYAMRRSNFTRSKTLNNVSFSGFSPVYQNLGSGSGDDTLTNMQGWLNVAMCNIPTEWQTALGGNVMGAGWGLSIVTRESYGPSAVVWDADAVTAENFVPGYLLLGYPNAHQTLGTYLNITEANAVYNQSSTLGGIVIVKNTRTMFQFGRIGTGIPCYGQGTSDPALVGTFVPPGMGQVYCLDPGDGGEGTHAYPYVYRVWAYDLLDLRDVKDGIKQYWQVEPYSVFTITLPPPVTVSADIRLGGAAYDETNQIIYITQLKANLAFAGYPLVHAFSVNAAGGSPPDPDPDPPDPDPDPPPPPPDGTTALEALDFTVPDDDCANTGVGFDSVWFKTVSTVNQVLTITPYADPGIEVTINIWIGTDPLALVFWDSTTVAYELPVSLGEGVYLEAFTDQPTDEEACFIVVRSDVVIADEELYSGSLGDGTFGAFILGGIGLGDAGDGGDGTGIGDGGGVGDTGNIAECLPIDPAPSKPFTRRL